MDEPDVVEGIDLAGRIAALAGYLQGLLMMFQSLFVPAKTAVDKPDIIKDCRLTAHIADLADYLQRLLIIHERIGVLSES